MAKPSKTLPPKTVQRFDASVRVPHMGWNRVTGAGDWIADGHAYFANSYRVGDDAHSTLEADGWSLATCDYAGVFVAAAARDGIMACQFHPELSGRWGLDLLSAWVRRTAEDV